MVTKYPNPLGGPSTGHTCAMPSSPSIPHAQLNHLPLDDFEDVDIDHEPSIV
jgi:hypothetical protein